MTVTIAERPRLAAKVRLRLDKQTNHWMLLYPEKGMRLSATAAAIAQLCTGEHSQAEIIDQLMARYSGTAREVIEREVHAFLLALAERGLLQ